MVVLFYINGIDFFMPSNSTILISASHEFVLTMTCLFSECVRCIALLQISVQSLLHCLEIVDANSADRKGYFSWQVEEAVKCASYLRRVYEEVK